MDIGPLISQDFLSLQKDQSLSSFIGELKKAQKRNALIFSKDKFVGIVEDKSLLKTKLNSSETTLSKYLKEIPVISLETDLVEAAYLMFQSDITFLPVTTNNHIEGVLYGLDLVREASKLEQLKSLSVDQIRLSKVPGLKPKDPLAAALAQMRKKKVWQLPICENNKCVGLISYQDILKKYLSFPVKGERSSRNVDVRTRAFESEAPEIDRLPLDSFDTHNSLQTITEKDKLHEAINLMDKKNISSLIVLRAGEYFGLLTLKNILRKIASLKVPQNFNIRFVGLEKTSLKPHQKYNLKKLASRESFKLQRDVHNEFNVIIHIKEYSKEASRHKYSVNIKLVYPGRIIIADKGKVETWDPEMAVRKAFNNAKNSLKSRFRKDSSRRKGYE